MFIVLRLPETCTLYVVQLGCKGGRGLQALLEIEI
jgi:hypothetical protein